MPLDHHERRCLGIRTSVLRNEIEAASIKSFLNETAFRCMISPFKSLGLELNSSK